MRWAACSQDQCIKLTRLLSEFIIPLRLVRHSTLITLPA